MPFAHLFARALCSIIEDVEERGGSIPCKNIIFVIGDLSFIGMKGKSRRWSSSFALSVAPSFAPFVAPSDVSSFAPLSITLLLPLLLHLFFLEEGVY